MHTRDTLVRDLRRLGGHDTVTFPHDAHIVDIPDKRVARYRVPVKNGGARVWRDQAEYGTADGAHASRPDGFFAQLTDGFLERSADDGGLVGDADSFLLRAAELLDDALPVMRAVATTARREPPGA